RMIENPPVMAASNFSLWTRLFSTLAAAPDVRLRPVLERAIAVPSSGSQFWPMLAQRCLELLRRPPERAPELTAAQREQLARLDERIATLAASPLPLVTGLVGRQAQLAAELLATIYAEPQVLEHRLVWADALIGRGDPRGEFIQLQFARPS